MTYFYIKALHIIFVVTWFAGLFYIVRLFIYNREAQDKPENERRILQQQFNIMIRRLWFGITWPSCILTLIFGSWLIVYNMPIPGWLWIKIGFLVGLFLYHFSIHVLYRQQSINNFKYSSQQLRIWNEVATIFLVAIVILVVVRSSLGLLWGMAGLFGFVILLMMGINLYKKYRAN
jgi:protoporphyrinogen IX oxidase